MSSLQSTLPRHGLEPRPLRIAVVDTRAAHPSDGPGGPAFEIGHRLGLQGHSVATVGAQPGRHRSGRGTAELRPSLLHHAAQVWSRLLVGPREDVVILLDPADALFVPLLRARGSAVVVHIGGSDPDGVADQGRPSFSARAMARRGAGALIADTLAQLERYQDDFAVQVDLIRRGTRLVSDVPTDLLRELRLAPGAFHLLTASDGPDDRIEVVLEGYHRSEARLPLAVIGRTAGPKGVEQLAARDPRIRLLGDVRDQPLLDQLHAHAASSLHGLQAERSDPSLLRAMGAGTAVIAWRSVAHREVAGTGGSYFSSTVEVTRSVEEVERYPFRFRDLGELMQERAGRFHDWDVIAEQYGALASKLARRDAVSGPGSGRSADHGLQRVRPAAGHG